MNVITDKINLIDIGNTTISIAEYELTSEKIEIVDTIFTANLTKDLNEKIKYNQVIISSVVPKKEEILTEIIKNKKIYRIYKEIKPEINIEIDNPSEVGADRIVCAFAAKKKYGNSLIILDFGTATTFDVVDKNGSYIGGIISSGVGLSIKSLSQDTAKLPLIEFKIPKNVIGKNTINSMQSGIYFGYIGLVNNIIKEIIKETSLNDGKIIITGGYGEEFYDKIESNLNEKFLDKNLIFDGLAMMYKLYIK